MNAPPRMTGLVVFAPMARVSVGTFLAGVQRETVSPANGGWESTK